MFCGIKEDNDRRKSKKKTMWNGLHQQTVAEAKDKHVSMYSYG